MDNSIKWTVRQAEEIARRHFGLDLRAEELPGYDDRIFRMSDRDGARWILKISLLNPQPQQIDFINRLLERLSGLPVPQVQPSLTGDLSVELEGGAQARLLSHLPGTLMARVQPHHPALLRQVGALLGEIDRRLEGFSHPGMNFALDWDLRRAGAVIRAHFDTVPAGPRRGWIEQILNNFEQKVKPLLEGLPAQVIYNDANDHNILVEGGRISGIFDFGDAMYAPRVFEPVIAAAYAMLGKPDPLEAAAEVLRGYQAVNPLQEQEVDLVLELIHLRLGVSVCMAARRAQDEPESRYHQVSAAPAWQVLEMLDGLPAVLGRAVIRDACGLTPSPEGDRLSTYLAEHQDHMVPLLVAERATAIDLSVGSPMIPSLDLLNEPDALGGKIFAAVERDGGQVGVGGYGESRLIYTADMFTVDRNQRLERRSVHLGVDLWAPAGTSIQAPLSGRIFAFSDNRSPQDYGPAIVLEHREQIRVSEGQPDGSSKTLIFYTLYGHLSPDSLEGLAAGMAVEKGQVIGRIGETSVNGGWPPHLHFQVISDMLGLGTDFPGVALPSQRDIYLSLCPDPNLLLKFDRAAWETKSDEQLLSARRSLLGPNLSLSYDRPLQIVRGWRQYLYDADGQTYLDCVNNVCHVGHSHPRVVEALAGQAAVLNTNTRYLHPNILDLAEKLIAKMPSDHGGSSSLSICYFVNSGSEANDLALRLARAYTGARDMLVLEGAYHGNLTSTIDLSPYKHAGPGGLGAPPWVHALPMPCAYRGVLRDTPDPASGYARMAGDELGQIATERRRPAGFISESILGTGGQVVFPEGYLAQVYDLVRAAGGVCIADEVQHGFGRLGSYYWGFETHEVVPDIVTLGKPFGNGHPLAAVVTRPEIAAAFDNGMEYFNTFGGNPVSAAVGLAVMEVIEEQGLQAHALAMGELWKAKLEEMQQQFALIGDVRGAGLFLGVELVRDQETLEPAPREAAYVVNALRQRGILLSTDGPLHNIIKIKPPLVIQAANIRQVTEEMSAAFRSMEQGGLL